MTDVREQPGRVHSAGGSEFDLVVAKLRRPLVRPGMVYRQSLIEQLARGDRGPIVSVVAPAGYGKTTLLSQWAERNGQAFAWVSVDEGDNDPRVLLTYVAEALNGIEPVGARVFDALASPMSSVPGSVVPRLGAAFSAMTAPVVLVLDDVHLLHNLECRAALSVLADHVPRGARLVLSGRDEPPLRIARLRAEGKILEIGLGDLSLTRAEAASLLCAAGLVLGDEDVVELHRRTEGWSAGLYLAALSLREDGSLPGTAVSVGGDDRFISDYMESEFLDRISPRDRMFLTRTAVLQDMSGPLCEAVLELPGSGAILANLARSNLLLVPLDHRGQWYRYHHLFRDMLLADLERQEPALIPVLQQRAASWCIGNGLPEMALEYSIAAGDVETTARLVRELWRLIYQQARFATLWRWVEWLADRGAIERHPMIAVCASLLAIGAGRPADAKQWAAAVDRWQYADTSRPEDFATEAWAAVVRAFLCRRGLNQMAADADEAARKFAAEGIVVPTAKFFQGIACVLRGDPDGGDVFFEEAFRVGEKIGTPAILADSLAERSLLAMARGEWDRAEAFAEQARAVLRRAGIEETLVCAVNARVALHRRDVAAVREELVSAQRLRYSMTYAMPHVAVQARIELARVHLALGDIAGARTLTQEVDELLKRQPDLGTLVGEAQALRARLSTERGSRAPGASALTAAELRLLPLLSTHMPVPEIAAELFLSPYTIKSELKSVYRKLGVSSRSQAVTRSQELGLLEG